MVAKAGLISGSKTIATTLILMLLCGVVGAFINQWVLQPMGAEDRTLQGCRLFFEVEEEFWDKFDPDLSALEQEDIFFKLWDDTEKVYIHHLHHAEPNIQLTASMAVANMYYGDTDAYNDWAEMLWNECADFVEAWERDAYEARGDY